LLSFPISYQTADIPDSLAVGFINSKPDPFGVANPNSELTVDNISFSGTTQNIQDPGFESWYSDTSLLPKSWPVTMTKGLGYVSQYTRSTDRYSGKYALEMRNNSGWPLKSPALSANKQDVSSRAPGFALHRRVVSLNGYFKYFPQGKDSFSMQLNIFFHDSAVASVTYVCDTTCTQFTRFSMPVSYTNDTIVPDSASITISGGGQLFRANSRLIIDALTFDGFIDSVYGDTLSAILTPEGSNPGIKIYPNPANSSLFFSMHNIAEEKVEISIMNTEGQMVEHFFASTGIGNNIIRLDVSAYSAGVYFVVLKNQSQVISDKFIKVSR
jgi:hypothetical protein